MKKEIDKAAENLGISSMEYIRRACRDNLSDPDEKVRAIVKLVFYEMGIKYNV